MICPLCMENAAMVAGGIVGSGGLAALVAGRFRWVRWSPTHSAKNAEYMGHHATPSTPTQRFPSKNQEEVENGNCNGRIDEA